MAIWGDSPLVVGAPDGIDVHAATSHAAARPAIDLRGFGISALR
jgi:hypothetical protein